MIPLDSPLWFGIVKGVKTRIAVVGLVLLVLVMGAIRIGWPVSRRGLARGLGYAGLGVGLFALGFILAKMLQPRPSAPYGYA